MHTFILSAPRWALSVMYGVFFGAWMIVLGLIWGDSSPIGTILSGVVSGVIFGAAMGYWISGRNEQARALAGSLSDEQFRAAARAVLRGPVPTDPQVHEAAEQLAVFRLDQYHRQRQRDLPLFVLATLVFALAAVFSSPWWALGSLAFAFLFVSFIRTQGRLTRRIELLQGTSRSPGQENEII